MLQITDKTAIDRRYLRVRYIRSRGPGGQNVNKVNTRAELTFDLAGCPGLPPAVKERLAQIAGTRVTAAGTLILRSDRFRHQGRNRAECLARLQRMVAQALIPPRKRRPTRPTAGSRARRRADKLHRARIKSLRRTVSTEE